MSHFHDVLKKVIGTDGLSSVEKIKIMYKDALEDYYVSGACDWGQTIESGRLWGFEDSLMILGVSQEEIDKMTKEARTKYAKPSVIVEQSCRVGKKEEKSFFSDPIRNLRKMMKI